MGLAVGQFVLWKMGYNVVQFALGSWLLALTVGQFVHGELVYIVGQYAIDNL